MIRFHSCWFSELFSVNDFTVPGAAISRGDGKNPATHQIICPQLAKRLRFPAAVLLRSAIQKRHTAKVVLRLLERTTQASELFPSTILSRLPLALISL